MKQILKLASVAKQDITTYKGHPGILIMVKDNPWTSVVQGGIALADSVEGTVDYMVEKVKDIPEEVLEAVGSAIGKAGSAPGVANEGYLHLPFVGDNEYKILFVPDDETRAYLIFDRSLGEAEAEAMFNQIIEHDADQE